VDYFAERVRQVLHMATEHKAVGVLDIAGPTSWTASWTLLYSALLLSPLGLFGSIQNHCCWQSPALGQ